MKPGDTVIYLADLTLYGRMHLVAVTRDGLLECIANPGTMRAETLYFWPREIDRAPRLCNRCGETDAEYVSDSSCSRCGKTP